MGVPINQLTQALGVYMGSQYVNDFDFNNRSYRPCASRPALPDERWGSSAVLCPLGLPRTGAAGKYCFTKRDIGTPGDQSLQSVSLGRDRRRGRYGIQFQPRPESDGRTRERAYVAGNVVQLV